MIHVCQNDTLKKNKRARGSCWVHLWLAFLIWKPVLTLPLRRRLNCSLQGVISSSEILVSA
jgi:hypothetical protein